MKYLILISSVLVLLTIKKYKYMNNIIKEQQYQINLLKYNNKLLEDSIKTKIKKIDKLQKELYDDDIFII